MADAKAAVINDAGEDADASAAQGKSKFALKLPPLKFLIIGGVAFLVLAGGGGGADFFFSHKPAAEPQGRGARRQARGVRRSA